MTYGIIIETPDVPIKEDWDWLTDVNTSNSGLEDVFALRRYPRRTFSGTFSFSTIDRLRRHLALMTRRFVNEFDFPLWQYQTKLKAAVAIGATTATVNARRGNFRVGGSAFLIEDDTFEEVAIDAVTDTTITFAAPLAHAYSKRAVVCPVATVFSNTNATITRRAVNTSGTSSFTFVERQSPVPFVSPLNEATVDTFGGLPILPYVTIGDEFATNFDTGVTVTDYTAKPELTSPWLREQWKQSLKFVADLIGGVDDLEFWQLFGDTVQGSANPFLFPTNREDFKLVTSGVAGGNAITVAGDEFSQHYWGHGAFSRIFIDTDAGRHYASITGVASVAGNDRLTFSPALPGGAGWASNQRVGFLLKLRIDNDKISLQHSGLYTEITIAVKTVP
jgi:hypothetical protein